MDVRTVKDLCQRLDEVGTILELMEGEPINVALHREASDVLNQALSEIERLRSEADLHRETSHALRDALVEIERLQSEAADLQHTKFDRGLSNLSPTLTASATDWFKKFLERKQVLTGEIKGTESHAD
jgi:cell division septum initiation protein DivIVA